MAGKKVKMKGKVFKTGSRFYVPLDLTSKINSRDKYTVDHKKKVVNFTEIYYKSFTNTRPMGEILIKHSNDNTYGVKSQEEYDLVMKKVDTVIKTLNKVPIDEFVERYLKGERAKTNVVDKMTEDDHSFFQAEYCIGDLVKHKISNKTIRELYRANAVVDNITAASDFEYDYRKFNKANTSLYDLIFKKIRSEFNGNYFKVALFEELGYQTEYLPHLADAWEGHNTLSIFTAKDRIQLVDLDRFAIKY